jgi:ABC-type branched-subunit amino acid transport system permease subunit
MLSLETSFAAVSLGIVGGSGTILGPLIAGYVFTVVLSSVVFPPLVRMSVYALLLIAGVWLHPWRPLKEGHA